MNTQQNETVKAALKVLETNNNRLLSAIHHQEKRDTTARMRELEIIQARLQQDKRANQGKYNPLYNIQHR